MKKTTFIAACFLVVISAMTSCGFSGNSEEDDGLPVIKLALREGIYSDVIEKSVESFEKKEKVHCEIEALSEEELHTRISEDAKNPHGQYDLCMVDGSWMAEYTHAGILANLSEMGYEIDDDIIPSTTKVCYRDDSVYLAPYFGNVTVLLYNKAIVKQTGYRASEIQSLEDVLTICQKAKKKGNLGFMYRGDTTNNYVVDFLPILSSFGGWVVDEKNEPTVDTPEFRQAMEFYLKLIKTGKAESRDQLTVAVANNAAAMAVGWPGWYTPGKKSTADYCAFSGKAKNDSREYNANVYGIWTLGIPANTTKKELSIKLLTYLMDAKVQKKTIGQGGVPCRFSSLKDKKVLEKYPQYKAVCNALENGIYRPIMVEWPVFYEILGDKMAEIIEGKLSVKSGLQAAQKELEAKLNDKGSE